MNAAYDSREGARFRDEGLQALDYKERTEWRLGGLGTEVVMEWLETRDEGDCKTVSQAASPFDPKKERK